MIIAERNRQKGARHNYSYVERVIDRLQPARAFFVPLGYAIRGLQIDEETGRIL